MASPTLLNQPVVFGQITDPQSVDLDGAYKELIANLFVNCVGKYRQNSVIKFIDDIDLEKGFKVGLRTRTVFWMGPEIKAGHHFADIKFPGIARKYFPIKDFHIMATAVSNDYFDYTRNYELGYHEMIMNDAQITANEKMDFIFYQLYKGTNPLYKDVHFENIEKNAYNNADGSTNGIKVYGVTYSIEDLITPKKVTEHKLDKHIKEIKKLLSKEKVEIDVTKAKIKETLKKYNILTKDVAINDDNLEFGTLKVIRQALKKTLKNIVKDPRSHAPGFNKTDGQFKDETDYTFDVSYSDLIIDISSDIIEKWDSVVKTFEVNSPDFFEGFPAGVEISVRDEFDADTIRIKHRYFLNVVPIGRYTKYGDYQAYQRKIDTGISTMGFLIGCVEPLPCYNLKIKRS